jgi:hypothetical protein
MEYSEYQPEEVEKANTPEKVVDIRDRIVQNVMEGLVSEAIEKSVKNIDDIRKIAPFLDDDSLAHIFETEKDMLEKVSFQIACSDEEHIRNSEPDLLVRSVPQEKIFKKGFCTRSD